MDHIDDETYIRNLAEEIRIPPTVPLGMTVGQLLFSVPENDILESFEALLPKAAENRAAYRRALAALRDGAPERTRLSCMIEMRVPYRAPEGTPARPHVFVLDPAPKVDPYFARAIELAGGRPVRAPALNGSLDWNKWSCLPIELAPGSEVVPHREMAAWILREATWAGVEAAARQDKLDAVDRQVAELVKEVAATKGSATTHVERWDE